MEFYEWRDLCQVCFGALIIYRKSINEGREMAGKGIGLVAPLNFIKGVKLDL